jgi:hypothetical protein
MRSEQAGFLPNKSYADHTNTIRIIFKQSVEFRSSPKLVFIDFQQAFYTLAHNAIWQALKEKGVPQKNSYYHKRYIRPVDMKCSTQKPGIRTYSSAEWSKTGLCSVTPFV